MRYRPSRNAWPRGNQSQCQSVFKAVAASVIIYQFVTTENPWVGRKSLFGACTQIRRAAHPPSTNKLRARVRNISRQALYAVFSKIIISEIFDADLSCWHQPTGSGLAFPELKPMALSLSICQQSYLVDFGVETTVPQQKQHKARENCISVDHENS